MQKREFKLKLYPNLALAIAFPFIFMIIGLDRVDFAEIITNLQSSKSYLSIYAFAFVIPTILIMLRYSEKYMGAWIYKVAPIKNTSSIFKGVIKGAIYKLILPSYTMISIIFIVAFGFKVIIHLVIAFLVFMILIVLNFLVSKNVFPFSKKFEAVNGGEGIISLLFSILCILLALGVHFIIIKSVVAQYVYLIILIIINLLLWKFSFNIVKKKLIG